MVVGDFAKTFRSGNIAHMVQHTANQVPNTWVILADNTNENWLEKEFPPKLEKKM